MLGRTDSRSRALLLLLAFVIAAGSLGARLAYWQVVRRDELAALATKQSSMRYEIPADRGSIYDRTGTVVLATSVSRDRLAANPKLLTPLRRVEVANKLIEVLGLTGEAADALRVKMLSESEYKCPRPRPRRRPPTRSAASCAGETPAVPASSSSPSSVRIYPQAGGGPDTTLAAHLLGFVNREGAGQYGVEQRYQDAAGRAAARGRGASATRRATADPRDRDRARGRRARRRTSRSRIDAILQLALEQEVLAAWVADRAKRVSAVVMDPYTGEILAEATYPSYDANDYPADRRRPIPACSSTRSCPPSTSRARCSRC